MNFGTFLKQNRKKLGVSLRQYCRDNNFDAGYISRIENNLLPAPTKENLVKKLALSVNIEKDSPDWTNFFDLAALSRNQIPDDIIENNTDMVKFLPAFFRSIRKKNVTKGDIKDLIKLIKGGYEKKN
jgi:transcriptional regulator with XRE-family HTH domain